MDASLNVKLAKRFACPYLGVTTSHSTRLQTTAAKSLVIPLAEESWIGEAGMASLIVRDGIFAMPICSMQIYAYPIGLRREKQSLAFVAVSLPLQQNLGNRRPAVIHGIELCPPLASSLE